MPVKKLQHAKTGAQQKLMGQALSVKRGEQTGSKAAQQVAKGMSERQLKEFATKPKSGYPGKKKGE